MTIAGHLARHVAALRHADLPDATREQAVRCLLDTVGNMLGGRDSPKARAVDVYLGGGHGPAEATVVGGGRVGCEAAAFANAALARMHDLDDGHQVAMGHPASVLVPTALALGQVLSASGSAIVTALVAAYDVYAGLGAAINPSAYHERGFDSTGIVGCVAAAALASKLRGLDAETTGHAVGIAATHAGGITEYQNDGSAGKVLCPAWAARAGLQAADLARAGFTGPAAVFEGAKGHFRAFSNEWDGARATSGLGHAFGIQGNYFKLHACMRGLHGAVDAAAALHRQRTTAWEEASRIRIRTSSFVGRLDRRDPADLAQAQCSLPYCVALALKHGRVGQAQMQSGIDDPDIAALQRRIEVDVSGPLEDLWIRQPQTWGAAEVIIETRQGQPLRQQVIAARGGAAHPLSTDDLEAKFREQIAQTALAGRGDAILAAIRDIERIDDVGLLMDLLAAP
ncbi:MAG: MmgE/PrpD family protein [Burkholderiales bacterium]|nr:MmgE/PrpD family protein [Burkholderiales bacterium]MDE1925893.1 MmgE/PrpD family protein [Burkholderiales bacterium]MDE2157470.1 MmgE/PrpD family protein [Burkholderiales bacterium]